MRKLVGTFLVLTFSLVLSELVCLGEGLGALLTLSPVLLAVPAFGICLHRELPDDLGLVIVLTVVVSVVWFVVSVLALLFIAFNFGGSC